MIMEILKIKTLKHSGHGEGATHKKVIREFNKSEMDGLHYCRLRGWSVEITETLLTVKSKALFGFEMLALIKK